MVKVRTVPNTFGYYDGELIAAVKRFMVQVPGSKFTKLFLLP
jgi:hypothetical protein